MGVDEDTAAVVTFEDDRHVLRVIGRGAVTILDPSHIVSNAHEASRSHPILASGVVLHALPAGAAFDLTTRTLIARDAVDDATEAEQIAEAGRDLRRLDRAMAGLRRTRLHYSHKRDSPVPAVALHTKK